MLNKWNYIILFLFVLLVIVTGIWIVKIMTGTVPYIDQWTRGLVSEVDDSSIYTFFRCVTELGSSTFLVPFTIIMAFLLWWFLKDWLPALMFSGGTLVSHLLNQLIKHFVERERPSLLPAANAEGYSFPSGHAMISMVCYGLLAFFLVKKISSTKAVFWTQLFFALIIFLIGISRYFINVHYLTDVVGGLFIGFLLLISLIDLYRRIQQYRTTS
ncbi:phosphatase PAP2 family protein [Virgibacillus ainsalahensis]